MTKDETLKQALEALENISTALREDDVLSSDSELMLNAITAIEEALAQPPLPVQEPRNVRERWNVELDGNNLLVCFNDHEKGDKCEYERYSPERQWVGLTDEERLRVLQFIDPKAVRFPLGFKQIAESIERLLKEKNT